MKKQQKIVALALLAALAAAPAFAGIHYKAVTKTQDARGKSHDTRVEGWVAGDSAKVVIQESEHPILQKGSYLLTKNGAATIYLVNPQEKTYAEWDPQAMLGAAGAVLGGGAGPLLKFEITDPKVEKLSEAAGPALLGHSTRHSRFRTSYTMKMRVMGMGNETAIVTEEEIWATDQLTDPALSVWLRADALRTGNAEMDKLIESGRGKVTGFPLKTVTVSTSTNPKNNKQTVTRTTMEVTELDAKAAVQASAFEIPAGYEKTETVMALPGQGGQP